MILHVCYHAKNTPIFGIKEIQTTDEQRFGFSFSRDYWTRTSDLAPPRRVRYQLR